MRRLRRWLLGLLYAALVVSFNAAMLYAAWVNLPDRGLLGIPHAISEEFYSWAIPDDIEITSLVAHGADSRWYWLLFPFALRESCGGSAFGMSGRTAATIEADGLAKLQAARVGRGYRGEGQKEGYYTYESWRPTPVSKLEDGDGLAGLSCFGDNAPGFDAKAVAKAAREPGSYYTTAPERTLLVIPRLRLVVMTYMG